MIAAVATAIKSRYDALSGSIWAGGLFFLQAPQDKTGEYGVFYITVSNWTELMGAAANAIADIEVQFNLFSDAEDGGTEITTMYQQLIDGFDLHALSVSGYDTLILQKVSVPLLGIVDDVHQATVIFTNQIIKS